MKCLKKSKRSIQKINKWRKSNLNNEVIDWQGRADHRYWRAVPGMMKEGCKKRRRAKSSCTGKFNHLHLYLLWPYPLPFSLFLLCCDLSFSPFELCCFPLTFLSASSCHLHFISPIAPPSFHFLFSAQHHLASASMLFPHFFFPFLLSFPSLSFTSSSFFSFHPPVFALLSSHFSSYVSPQHFSFPISLLMLSFVSILFSSFPFPHISILLLISLSSFYLPFSPTVCPYLLSFILPISTCPPVTPPLSSSSSSLESVVWNSSVLALKLAAVPR